MPKTILVAELPRKALMINGFFSNINHFGFNNFARKEKHLSDLILAYTGDIPYVESAQKIYDRTLLQIEHEKKSIGDDKQLKPLKIVNMNSVEERKKIADLLRAWSEISMEQCEVNINQYSSKNASTEDRIRFNANITFYENLREVISDMFRKQISLLKNISVVMDDEGVIQAISVSAPDELNKKAWRLSHIITAPHNRIEGHRSCVKGAGSALIQDAIEKSIKRQGLNPGIPLTFAAMKNTAVTLHWTSSQRFYHNLFFEQDMDRKNSTFSKSELILKEDNMLFKFLENYGGRATMSTQRTKKVDTVDSDLRAEGAVQPGRSFTN